jgi:hypothetical protein
LTGSRLLLPLLCGVLLLFARSGGAAPAGASAVDVIIAGPTGDAAMLTEALREPMDRLQIELLPRLAARIDPRQITEPQSVPAVARLWFDLSQPGRVVLYVTDGPQTHVYVREIPLPQGLDEVAREQLTYIARACVETLLAGGELGVTREEYRRRVEPPPPPPPPAPPAVAQRGARLGVGLSGFYELQGFARGVPVVHGPGLGISLLRVGSAFRPLLLVTAGVRLPASLRDDASPVTFTAVPLRLGLGGDFEVSRGWQFRTVVGGGLDAIRVTPGTGSDGSVERAVPFWVTDPVARFALALGTPALGCHIWISVGSDLALRRSRYVVQRPTTVDPALTPWRFRPWLSLELGWGSE